MKLHRIVAVVLLIVYVATLGYIALVASGLSFGPINPSPAARQFQIPYDWYLTNTSTSPDVSVALNFNVPNGTIVAGEPITISGIAELKSDIASGVTDVAVGFQNSLQFPLNPDANGIYVFGTLNINTTASLGILKGSTTVVWETEGDYSPLVALVSNGKLVGSGTSTDVLIHVYPQTQLAQERLNQYNLALTYAILVLTALGIVTTFRELWKK